MKTASLVKHAFLSLFRNKRRTIMILAILGASTMIIFMTNSYLEQMYRGMQMGYIYQSGSIQVARQGFWDVKREGDLLLDSSMVEAAEDAARADDAVTRVNRELGFQGLVGTDMRSTIFNGMGVLANNQGGYAGYILMESGNTLDAQDPEGVIIGLPLAEKLGVSVDDYVNLMCTTVDGSMNLVSARVAGICTTGVDQADAYFCAGNLPFVQELRGTDGVDRLLIFLREGSVLEETRERLQARFAAAGLPLETRTWEELNPFYFDLKALYDGIFLFIKAIICILVFLSVMEIISMSFFERFRELGTLRAIGNTKGEIFLMLLFEVLFYAAIGIASGGALGALLASVLNGMNLSWTPPGSSSSVPFGFYIRAVSMISPMLTVLVASIVAAVFPALHSANKQVIEVLKYE